MRVEELLEALKDYPLTANIVVVFDDLELDISIVFYFHGEVIMEVEE